MSIKPTALLILGYPEKDFLSADRHNTERNRFGIL